MFRAAACNEGISGGERKWYYWHCLSSIKAFLGFCGYFFVLYTCRYLFDFRLNPSTLIPPSSLFPRFLLTLSLYLCTLFLGLSIAPSSSKFPNTWHPVCVITIKLNGWRQLLLPIIYQRLGLSTVIVNETRVPGSNCKTVHIECSKEV